MVAPLEAAPVESVGLAEPVGYPVGVLTPEVTTITAAETDRPNEAVFLSESDVAVSVVSNMSLLSYRDTTTALSGLRRATEAGGETSTDTRLASSNVEFVDGKPLRMASFFDGTPGRASLTEKILEGRRREYIAHGLVEPTIKQDPVRGENIEFVAAVDLDTNMPATSFRKVHMTEDGLDSFPSYGRFIREGGFSKEGLEKLEELAQSRKIVEIAGLWKDPAYSTDVKLALYKEAMQRSIERDEVWFMGIVTPEYRHLLQTYGNAIVQTLGQAVNIHEDHIPPTVRLRPVVIDPHDFYDTIIGEAEAARMAGDEQTRMEKEILVWHFLDGLDLTHLSTATLERIESMAHGRITTR